MGERGPGKTPVAIRVLRGETRPSQINHETPTPRRRRPTMPAGMSDASKKVWRRIMRDFGPTEVITAVDAGALRVYCEAEARYVYAAETLEQSGPLIRGARGGDLVKNPLNQVVRDNADLMRAFARELGLTPSARAGLTGKPVQEANPFDEFLDARRSA